MIRGFLVMLISRVVKVQRDQSLLIRWYYLDGENILRDASFLQGGYGHDRGFNHFTLFKHLLINQNQI